MNGGRRLAVIEGSVRENGITWYVGVGLDGKTWKSACPMILADVEQRVLNASASSLRITASASQGGALPL